MYVINSALERNRLLLNFNKFNLGIKIFIPLIYKINEMTYQNMIKLTRIMNI